MATPPKNRVVPPRRQSLLAISELERLGISPIEMLKEVYDLAIKGYKDGRGISDKADTGAGWLAVAQQAANNLASYKHPKLSAVAIKDVTDPAGARVPMTTAEAVKVLEGDPFKVPTKDVIDQIKSNIQTPALPMGEENK